MGLCFCHGYSFSRYDVAGSEIYRFRQGNTENGQGFEGHQFWYLSKAYNMRLLISESYKFTSYLNDV